MAETRTMARPYARAVFELGRDASTLAAWSEALAAVAEIVSNDDVARVIDDPMVSDTQLADIVIDIAGDALPEQGANYVRLLAANERLPLAPIIAEQFEAMRAAVQKRVDVTVVSVVEFSQEQQQALLRSLAQRFTANVSLSFEHDPELIGGAVIRTGDLVIDYSLRSQLAQMQQSLAQ